MSDRYRQLSQATTEERDVAAEHAAIVAAVLARATDQAAALLDRHVRRTDELVRVALLAERKGAG